MTGNTFDNCIFGVSAKRSLSDVLINKNVFRSVAIPVVITPIIGQGSSNIRVRSNEASDFWIGVRFDAVDGGEISSNTFRGIGYEKIWGPQDGGFSQSRVFQLNGSSNINIESNSIECKRKIRQEEIFQESDKLPGRDLKMSYSNNNFSKTNRVTMPSVQ